VTTIIDRFHGEFAFLSNFAPCEIEWDGKVWPTLEHAYQASKTLDPAEQEAIRLAETPGRAKRLGGKATLTEDWPHRRFDAMYTLLKIKFAKEPFRSQLLATDSALLIEGNDWHDQLWGDCVCEKHIGTPGLNMLGELLMLIRWKLSV
jgi:ribA/ribD-fused uncharacterized protein